MRVRAVFGPVAVLCGGLVLGSLAASIADGVASARAEVSGETAVAIARIAAPLAAPRVIGIPRDGTIVPRGFIPPALRRYFPPVRKRRR